MTLREPDTVAALTRMSLGRRAGGLLLRYAFIVVFVALFVFFGVQNPAFLRASNLENILTNSAILMLVALGLTFVVASGGIDLSVGIALDFGAWFSVVSMLYWGLPWPVAVLVGIASGIALGGINAILVVGFNVTPFLATLGTFFIGGSAQRIATNGGADISFRKAPDGFRALSSGSLLGISNLITIALMVTVLAFIVLQRSKYGLRIGAIGLQKSAVRVAGIATKRYITAAFLISGGTAALGGVLLTSGIRLYTPLAGFSYLLDAIAAVFIGASLHKDQRPNVAGTAVAVLFLGMLRVGFDIMGVDFNLKAALNGLVLLVALAFAYSISKSTRKV